MDTTGTDHSAGVATETSDFNLDSIFDPDSCETLGESPAAYVVKACFWRQPTDAGVQWCALKSSSTRRVFSKKPHDIVKELRVLQSLYHSNVIEVIGHGWERAVSTIHFWMPYIPGDLHSLLESPAFSPHTLPGSTLSSLDGSTITSFILLTKSLMFQIVCGVAYLHDNHIAHRDIKPRNILLTEECCVKLIDFGIAWTDSKDLAQDELWPEPPGEMCFDVSTGPYRAVELLFGANAYDAFAIDLWSLGATFAEFFTSLKLENGYHDYKYEGDDLDEEEEEQVKTPFIIPCKLSLGNPDTVWVRESLFNATRGSIGLAWSIFSTLGTPTDKSWPSFKDLPDADKVSFRIVPPVALQTLLPNLPPTRETLHVQDNASCLEIIQSFLVYQPTERLKASTVCQHKWFTKSASLMLPGGYTAKTPSVAITVWEGKTLHDLLVSHLSHPKHGP